MINIDISDITLREEAKREDVTLSFKEKIEIAKQLDRLNINVIETAPITKGKTDILFLHTIAPIIKNSVICCPVTMNPEEIDIAYDAIKNAAKPRLNIMIPVSTVQMEYLSHKKPAQVLEDTKALTAKAVSVCGDVEVSFLDATRAESEFLYQAIVAAIENGAKNVTLCDTAGTMLPAEFEAFVNAVRENVPTTEQVKLSVECSDELSMASATAVSCIRAGVTQIKTSMVQGSCPSLASIAKTFKAKADALGIRTTINMTVLENSIKRMNFDGAVTVVAPAAEDAYEEEIKLNASDDINTVRMIVEKMGYELSEDDMKRVYDEFVKLRKQIGSRELDAIIASVTMQVAPTYKLKSYVVNNGNIITPTAQVELDYRGEPKQGFCIGDGPIDAAFLAIEQITGHHYELDDFQIQSVTEGREAVGSAIVKLRSDGKLYSGKGVSTDIIGASINAYINALNKICFEEE
ncbi:MAG: hypothetical protein IJ460_02720 [Clostridia bacterium]|nr:hypothetical protein [Clostridia bacterium]